MHMYIFSHWACHLETKQNLSRNLSLDHLTTPMDIALSLNNFNSSMQIKKKKLRLERDFKIALK